MIKRLKIIIKLWNIAFFLFFVKKYFFKLNQKSYIFKRMNNQNRILKHHQLDDIGEDEVSFQEDEEEHNYLGKKKLLEIEGDKWIFYDFSLMMIEQKQVQ